MKEIIIIALSIFAASINIAAQNNKPVKVFIIAGQSNAVGYNHIKEYEESSQQIIEQVDKSKIMFWAGSNAQIGHANCWANLQLGVSDIAADPSYRDGCFGPEIGFSIKIADVMPDDKIAIIKYAVGGTGIARSEDYNDYIPELKGFNDNGNNWHPATESKPAGLYYTTLIANINTALSQLTAQSIKYKLCGVIWMQGEHESGISKTMASDYGTLLSLFRESLRKDLKSNQLPFIIGEINSHTWAFAEIGRKSQLDACNSDKYSILIKTTDLPRIGIGNLAHFNASGMLTLGERFADGYHNSF